MRFSYQSIDLPIVSVIPEVIHRLEEENTLILHAPPGAGKSTLLPLALLESTFLKGKKILMLEPRRLASKSIAGRMAELLQEQMGETVGFRIRFENQISNATRIEVLTEGVLTRKMIQDNALEEVGLVIFDEFHERNIHAELAMALCREIQTILRPDLRILVMSATLDIPHLAKLLNAKTVSSEGKLYPVNTLYTEDYDLSLMPEYVSKAVVHAAGHHSGDILVFLPGQGEIKKTEELLRKKLPAFSIHPLYGQLSFMAQKQAILPNKSGKRKVVLSTSIAETSLTIEGISIVIDSGYRRISQYNPKSGLSKLVTMRVTQDAADQRSGRAGRLGPGICYRLWSKSTQMNLSPFRTPEILEADLSPLVLDLLSWGISDFYSLLWITSPPSGAISQALELLEQIDAIENGKITPHGRSLHRIPAHPRIAHMLLKSKEKGNLALATDLAALLEERDPLESKVGVDINLRIETLRRNRRENMLQKGFNKIEKVARQYRKLFQIPADNDPFDPYEAGVLIAMAYPERIAHAKPGNQARFQMSSGKMALMDHRDDLAHEPWLAISHVDAREDLGKIFLAAPVNPKDLMFMLKERRLVSWDLKSGALVAEKRLSIGGIVLKSEPIRDFDPKERKVAILKAVETNGEQLLDFSEESIQLINRVNSLKMWNRKESWPDFDLKSLLLRSEEWLAPYIEKVSTKEELKKLDLKSILFHYLDYEQQQALDKLAPEKLTVPSGSHIKIKYRKDGEAPILSVRLQEVFGLMESPRINNDRTALLLHLLSPGFKPVQITSDLKSFWNNTYQEVKKELKGRYPKHAWPENPLEAIPQRGVPKKQGP